jgi:hypothetical protein
MDLKVMFIADCLKKAALLRHDLLPRATDFPTTDPSEKPHTNETM